MFYVDAKHDGLKKFRRLSGSDKYVVERRAQAQADAWSEQWQRRLEIDGHRNELGRKLADYGSKKEKAARATTDAQSALGCGNGLRVHIPINSGNRLG